MIQWIDRYSKRRDRDLRPELRRRRPPCCVVLHTTGYPSKMQGLRAIDAKYADDADVDEAYSHRMDKVLEYKCEFLVGRTGTIYRMTEHEEYFAYHTGSRNRKRLRRRAPGKWWRKRHPNRKRATQLPAWRHGSPNSDSWGVDLLAPRGGGANFPRVQRTAAARLVAYLTSSGGILIGPETVLDHSSLDPIERCNKWGPWDLPDKFDLNSFRAEAKKYALEYGVDYERMVCR